MCVDPDAVPCEIPDGDWLYRRIPPGHWARSSTQGIRFEFASFTDRELSVQWHRHSSPREALSHALTEDFKSRFGLESVEDMLDAGWRVAQLSVAFCREPVLGQTVAHMPDPDNYAHTEIQGRKRLRVSTALAEHARQAPLDGPNTSPMAPGQAEPADA